MISKEEIKENYSKFSDDKLLNTVNEITSLRKDIIPILHDELKNRNLKVGLDKINDFLLKEVSKKPSNNFDPKKFIEKQLEEGYSLDTIKHKLNHMEINMFDVMKNDKKDNEFIKQYIKTSRNKGKKITKIKKELKENFNIPTEKTHALNEILIKEGTKNIFIGIVLVILAVISFVVRGGIGVSTVVFLPLGLWKIIEGSRNS